jgi:glycosyltransferase involved in cell wall biosynthesis
MLTKADPDTPDASAPKFSAIWLCGGNLKTAAQCIASLEAQTCADFELVLHDDDASDATEALVSAARRRNWPLRLVPAGSGTIGERLLSLLRNCRGDYIAILPSEGRFRPQTFDLVMRRFRQRPGICGLCARRFLVHPQGKALPNVDIVTLLFTTYRPFLSAGFIDRKALAAAGLFREGWCEGALDLELWSRLAIDHGIGQLDEDFLEDLSGKVPWDWLDMEAKTALDDRIDVIAKVFSREGFFRGNDVLEARGRPTRRPFCGSISERSAWVRSSIS